MSSTLQSQQNVIRSELKLIEAVELKFALASTDASLQKITSIYLCPLLLKLGTPHPTNKQKVDAVLQMLDNRFAGASQITLPFDALLSQFKDEHVSDVVKSRTIDYLGSALDDRVCGLTNIQALIAGFAHCPAGFRPKLFQLICRLIIHFPTAKSTVEERALETNYHIDCEEDRTILADCLINLMLLTVSQLKSQVNSNRPVDEPTIRPLRQQDLTFLSPFGPSTYTITSLNNIKLGVLNYASIALLKEHHRYVIALIASFDLKHEIQMQANTVLRKCDLSHVEQLYVDELYKLLLERSLEARLQIRIFQLLSKCVMAAKNPEKAQSCITRGVESSSPRVRTAAIGFLNWYARFSPASQDSISTRRLLAQLTMYISSPDSSDESKGSAYVAIGLLCKRDVNFTRDNTEIIQTLFEALANQAPPVRPAIEEALSSLMYSFASAGASCLQELRSILLRVLLDGPTHTHYTALRLALSTFDFDDVSAKWMCIFAMRGKPNVEVYQEAKRGLSLSLFVLTQYGSRILAFPKFQNMVSWPQENDVAKSLGLCTNDLDAQSMDAYLSFSRTCLFVNALNQNQNVNPQQENFEARLEATFNHDESARETLRLFVNKTPQEDFHRALTLFVEQIVSVYTMTFSQSTGKLLLEFLVIRGNCLADSLMTKLVALQPKSDIKLEEQRDLQTRLYSIVSTSPKRPQEDIMLECRALIDAASTQNYEGFQAMSLLMKILLRSRLRGHEMCLDLTALERTLQDNLHSREVLTLKSTMDMIATLGLSGNYSLAGSMRVARELIVLVGKSSTDSQVVERGVLALGNLSVCFKTGSKELTDIIEVLSTDTGTVAKAELLLAKGEALACCIGRWESKALRDTLDVPVAFELAASRSELVLSVIDALLCNTRSTKPQQRRGACLRLVSLVQLLDLKQMANKWTSIHGAFVSLLSDGDEFVSETANKGIQIVYDRCDKKTKDDLIAQLFATMTSDTAAKQSTAAISEESEVFQPGTMTVGSGSNESSLSTYKDICNLAIDAGNSSLVYSFLSLASSTAMWSTRRGVALGLNSLLNNTSTANELRKSPEVLVRLLPKLFRYKHDPSTKVANSMNAIFLQLYPDAKLALDQHFDLVCTELLKSLADQAWRVRESAGRAMSSLITGRPLASIATRLEEIWTLSFRILDDVKESVRAAGVELCQNLSGLIIRAVSGANSGSEASKILDFIIPLFVKNLRSLSAEVGSFSLKTLLRITKESGPSIKAHLPQLIDEFLQLTSNMEPEMMNYLSFHAAKYNITQADLDSHRLASIRASPLLDALEQCIDQLDEKSMAQTVPLISHIIRQTSGLPTKAATARFLISLTVRCPTIIQPHADTLIQALSTTLHDRNQSVVQTYASCIGYLARVTSAEKLVKLISFTSVKFLKADDENNALGLVLKAISQNANDKFMSMASIFFPLCFMGMHDPEGSSASLFKGIWQDNTGSAQAIKLYLTELLPPLEMHLTSPIWRIKQMSAYTIAEIASKVDLGQQIDRVFDALVKALAGKSWNGKEAVLQALVALTTRNVVTLKPSQVTQIRTIMFREARRTNMEYKVHALEHLATFVKLDKEKDHFGDTLETVQDVLDGSVMDEDTDDFGDTQKLALIQNSLKCLANAFNPSNGSLKAYRSLLKHCVHQAEIQTWTIKTAICLDLKGVHARIIERGSFSWDEKDVIETWNFLRGMATDTGYQSLRESASDTIVTFASSCRNVPRDATAQIERDLVIMIQNEQSTIVQAILRQVKFP